MTRQATDSRRFRFVIQTSLIAALAGILFGYDTAVISGAIGPITDHFQLSPLATGWAVSSVVIGAIIGALGAGAAALYGGRRGALWLAAALFIVSALGSALAADFFWYSVFRMLGGLAVGLASVVAPMYLSEISPGDMRGTSISLFQQSTAVGAVIVFFVNYFIARGVTPEWLTAYGWRWMLGSEVVPAILFAALLPLIPESPRWLILKNRDNEARHVLDRANPSERVAGLVDDIKASFAGERAHQRVSLRKPGIFGIVAIGAFVAAAQQLTGINVVMYYAPQIFERVVDSSETALLQTSVMGIAFVFGNLAGMLLIDRVGRRPLITYGSLGCCIGMAGLGTIVYSQSVGYGALICLVLYIMSFAISWGCVCWTLIGEIFPNSIRSRAMAFAVACQWFAGFVVTQTFPLLDQNPWLQALFNGGFSFWLYAGFTLICLAVVLRFVPETKNRTLEELEPLLLSRIESARPGRHRRDVGHAHARSA
ncbi:sugar porter family MFS transporter [uncultured Salinisphaera sp.]|uniref:sugar porter family MFS transporter n=1 Tax=uncultured Salinisphaera sp. TaxID=359372 RepID=UPI0032B2039C|tara:strand:- start:21 stop:1469 length:1449 start_codon:yes stop_codon:yes gene_type:complete